MSSGSLLALEVMDKELSARMMLLVFASLGVTGFMAGLWRKWAALLVGVGIVVFTGGIVSELRDPFVGPDIRAEAGWSYVAALVAGFASSSIATVLGIWLQSRHHARRVHG